MNWVHRFGLTVTIALSAAGAAPPQAFDTPALPPPAPRAVPGTAGSRVPAPAPLSGVIGGVPGGIVGGIPGGVPAAAPEPLPWNEPIVAPEPPEPPEPALAPEAPEPLVPPEPALAPVPVLAPETPEPPEPALAPPAREELAFALQEAPRPPQPPRAPHSESDDRVYERGQRDLERSRYDQALDEFGEVASRGGSRADGALYWKAYVLNKLGRRDESLAAVAELRKNYASSRWLDDARALEIEVKQAAGKPVTPESSDDEELKLMALNSFLNSDPERALPLLEKLIHSSQSVKVKERALFVLTQSNSPKARQLVVAMAKGGSNPDLQMKAVHYLGVMGGRQELGDVYAAASDVEVKRAVLHGLMVAGAKEQLLAAAKGEKSPELRQDAIHWLGTMGAEPELWQLYQNETSLDLKRQIVHALFVGGKTDHLVDIARSAKEPELRQDAIHWLGASGSHKAGDALAAMYASESSAEVKKQIIHALFIQGNAHAMVEIARKETNMELKKQIVHDLSLMGSKEGTDYLLELLNK